MSGQPLVSVARSRDDAIVHRFDAMQIEVRVLVSTDESGGAECVTEFCFAAPFAGPPPHWHRTYGETFVCLEGEFTVVSDQREQLLRPGDVAFVPPGSLHTYRVDRVTPTRYLLVCTPGSHFERYIAEAALHAAEAHRLHRPADVELLRAIRGRHQTYEQDVPRV